MGLFELWNHCHDLWNSGSRMLLQMILPLALGWVPQADVYKPVQIKLAPEQFETVAASKLSLPDQDNATVCVFVTTQCPIGNRYAPEISRIERDYRSKHVKVVLVYPEAADSPAKIKEHLKEYKLDISAVRDPDKHLVKEVRATVTPEVALIAPSGDLLYRGRIDDLFDSHSQAKATAKIHDLRLALDDYLAGKLKVPRFTTPTGCFIE